MSDIAATTEAPAGVAVHDPSTPHVPLVSPGYRSYALVVLLVLYTIAFLDRQIVVILAEPIKDDLNLTDTQVGVLTGLAFGFVYAGLGLVLARLADRFNRVWIIGWSLVSWSIFTLLCGRATNFTTLLIARMGVGVGEAGFVPTSHALIADYVPREQRASALAFFAMGTPLGSLLGLAMGGIIADAYGWRTAFLVAGVPGLVLALVVFLTLREPRKAMSEAAKAAVKTTHTSFVGTLKYLASKRSFWFISFGASIKSFIGYGHTPFTAAFFLRVHEAEVAAYAAKFGLQPVGFVGLVFGLLIGIFVTASSFLGGFIADRFGGRDLRAYCSVPAISSILMVPLTVVALLADSALWALIWMMPLNLLAALWYGPVYATAQTLVPPHMRATSASILLFIINMVGLGFGALAVGALSDFFNFQMGLGEAEGVRWALIVSGGLGLLSGLLFWMGRRYIREDAVS
jgi:MFS family permease